MEKLDISPGIKLEIVLEDVSGDLRVRTWDRDAVGADGDRVSLSQPDDGRILVRCEGDCRLNVPEHASLQAQNIAGDARITGVGGEITLDNVAGDLILRDAGSARMANVSADLRIKRVDGNLHVNHIGSDATVREVRGDVQIGHVGADLYINDVDGDCEVNHVGSDLVLNMAFRPGGTYRFRAGSDVVCRIPADSNVRFVIPAHTEVTLSGDYDEEMVTRTQAGDKTIVTFGEGGAEVLIEAGSEVRLVSQSEDEGVTINAELGFDLGAFDFSAELEERMADIERALADKLSGLDERLRVSVERQAAKAEKQADRLRRQAEKQADRLQRAAERRARKFTFSWGGPPTSPTPPTPPQPPAADPVSDEERMMILRMLENKQITVEEAEKLLAALEGRRK